MTIFSILSDLHQEFGPYPHPIPREADVLVLAGDIDVKGRGIAWAARVADGRPVIYVSGNHDPYGEKLPSLIDKMRVHGAPLGVRVLENEVTQVGNVRILGTTLWTDFALNGNPVFAMIEAGGPRGMNDYAKIRLGTAPYRKLTPKMTLMWHVQAVRWLQQELATPWDGPTMVVTHHAPHPVGCSPDGLADEMAPAYVSHLGALVAEGGAAVWVHGHTHWGHNTQVGSTRVISNAYGYPTARAPNFQPDFTITF